METLRKFDTLSGILIAALVVLDGIIGYGIFSHRLGATARAYFLDVGQGDSELIILPGGIKIMTDAGPDNKVLASLEKVLGTDDASIDIAIISHPQLDHFNGYNFIIDHYRIGAFIYNGRDDDPGVKAWPQLLAKIKEKNIPLITLGGGDSIHYGENEVDMLSPNREFAQSAELNDTGFVELVKTADWRALLTADIGFNVENYLLAKGYDIHADILKVPHHGSRYSSGDLFLRAVNPKAAIIEVGAKNTYGHPSRDALARIASSTKAALFRTDKNGTIGIWLENRGSGKAVPRFLLYN